MKNGAHGANYPDKQRNVHDLRHRRARFEAGDLAEIIKDFLLLECYTFQRYTRERKRQQEPKSRRQRPNAINSSFVEKRVFWNV